MLLQDSTKRNHRHLRWISPYVYLVPAVMLAIAFGYRPFVKTVVNSLSLVNRLGRIVGFVGFENFSRLFSDRNFQTSLANTFRFAVLFVPLELIWSMTCALLVHRKRRFNAFNELLFMMPMVVAMSSAAILFQALFNPTIGVVNYSDRFNVQWFNDPIWAMWVIVILCIWMAMGLDFCCFLSIAPIPRGIVEAAELEGASRWRIFWR